MNWMELFRKGAGRLLSVILMFAFVQFTGGYLIEQLSKNSDTVPDLAVEEKVEKQMVLQLEPVMYYTVQLGSFETAEEGQACIDRMAEAGYRVAVSDGPPYQISLGCMGKKPSLQDFPEEIRAFSRDVFVQTGILNETALEFSADDRLQMEQTAALLSNYDVVLRHSLQMFQDFRYEACSEEIWDAMTAQITEELQVIEQSAEGLLEDTAANQAAEKIEGLKEATVQYRISLQQMKEQKTDRAVLMAQSCLLDVIEKYHGFIVFENSYKLYL